MSEYSSMTMNGCETSYHEPDSDGIVVSLLTSIADVVGQ